jgi:hypothetical protein
MLALLFKIRRGGFGVLRKKLRYVCAFFLLAIIASQGTAEMALLLTTHPLPTAFATEKNHQSNASESSRHGGSCCESKPSFCSEEKPAAHDVVVCTCQCCGPVCPMGAKCTCNAPKVHVSSDFLATIVFRPMTCHPVDPQSEGWLPPSLQYMFLPPVAYEINPLYDAGNPIPYDTRIDSGAREPLLPPPKQMA